MSTAVKKNARAVEAEPATEAVENGERGLVETKPAPPIAFSWASMRTMAEAIQVAELVAKSNAFPKVKNAGQALVLMLAGAEMGFGCFASLVGVHMIQGVPTVGAHLKAAAIRQSGRYDYEVLTEAGKERECCALAFYSLAGGKRKHLGTIVEEIGLVPDSLRKKDNWCEHPDDMLFATAINKGYRRYCPDLTGGVLSYDADELDDAPASAPAALPAREVIDVQPEPTRETIAAEPLAGPQDFTAKAAPPEASEYQIKRIMELVAAGKFTAEQVSGWLAHFKRDRLEDFTAEEASKLIRGLEDRIAKQAAPAPAAAG